MKELSRFNVTTSWIKINEVRNFCFITNEAIAFNLQAYIVFRSLNSDHEIYYRADLERGDGVAVIAGHKNFPIFAFAENCWNAKIFIISYPDFAKISTFESKDECIYIGLSFSETEHLIALTGMPEYKLQVWFWRTHDMLISKETEMLTDKQKITCSNSLPLTVAQFAYKRGELIVWEIHGSQKLLKLIKRKIDLNFLKIDGPFHDVFTVEGNLLIVNRHGDIHYAIPSTSTVNTIVKRGENESEKGCATCIVYLRNGALVAAPNGDLKYFKRQKFIWNEIFHLTPPQPFISLHGYLDNEAAVGTTDNGSIYKLTLSHEGEKLNITKLCQYNPFYTNFVLIHPHGDYLVAVDSVNKIHCIHIKTGASISRLFKDVPEMREIVVESNPHYPFVAIGNNDGNVFCVQLLDPKNPTLLTEFLLSRQAIKSLRFSNNGNYLIVIDAESNHFIISSMPGCKMTVLHHFKREIFVKEFFAIEARNELALMFLTKSVAGEEAGSNDRVMKIIVKFDDLEGEMEFYEWELITSYGTILPFGEVGAEVIYGIREKCRYIEVLKLEPEIILMDQILTPHQLRHMEACHDGHHLITWSIDGIVAVFNLFKDHQLLCCFVAGNRHVYGIKKARCDPKRKFIVTLDYHGNLICSDMNVGIATEDQQRIQEVLNKSEILVHEKFSTPTSGGFPDLTDECQGAKKFIDMKDERAYLMEAEESEEARKILFKKLQNLRVRIKKLLDENESLPEDERLEIQEFNIDLATTSQKKEEAQKERDQQDKKMMEYIDAQTSMNRWIVEKCWNPLAVKGTKIRGMFLNMFVENYPLIPSENEKMIQSIKLIRAIENSVARGDAFLAWRPIPTIELEKILTKEPTMFELDSSDTNQYTKIVTAMMGSSSHMYLNISPLHYQQLDVVTFHQMNIEKLLIEHELTQMKKLFNSKFDEMHKTKENQIHSIRFKNDRLRHIQSEMKILDELKGMQIGSLTQILDPDFQSDEIPDTVINVIESEVPVAPYISPSTEMMLQEQEAAREKRRKELEADDFKDRALDVMMDGVLEHKWEDEIKKSPKTPECLVKNKPEDDWNEVEVRQVSDYNQEIEKLYHEREKYRRMLFEEQKLLQGFVDEEVQRFNYNLTELSLDKLKSDMAIGQEEMKLLMIAFYNFKRISYQIEEIKIRHKIENVKAFVEELTHIQTELQDWIRELKTNYENLQVKDKTLEKQFKSNFNESCPQAPADQAFKYFKRRPKLQMRAQITSPILLEIAKRVASKKLSQNIKLLPSECIEFLNGVDTLDQVATTTTGIDNNSWQVLCRMRRIKIESEFKIKSLGLQLADAESTLLAFMKEISNKRQHLQSVERQLVETKENRENDLLNRYVQLVMKRGLIEIQLTGSFTDFNDSILIHRSDVADINKIILKAGKKKLLALSNGAMFRRKINHKEWEHRVLKLKVKDLKECVRTIEKVKITKEVQQWLKRKARGWSENLDEDTLQKQIENTINSQEKELSDLAKEIAILQNQIMLKKKEMKLYDKEIQLLNIDVSEKNVMRDVEFERDQLKSAKERMSVIKDRARIVRTIQQQHSHLLQLSTLLELQRLKTFPTLSVKQI